MLQPWLIMIYSILHGNSVDRDQKGTIYTVIKEGKEKSAKRMQTNRFNDRRQTTENLTNI